MELDVTKSKKLIFSILLAKVDIGNIRGTLKIYYTNSLSIGVSTFVEKGKLSVNIPPLDFLDFEEGKEYKAELEVVAGDFFTVPWSKKFLVKKPVSIMVQKEMEENKEPYILVTKPIII